MALFERNKEETVLKEIHFHWGWGGGAFCVIAEKSIIFQLDGVASQTQGREQHGCAFMKTMTARERV